MWGRRLRWSLCAVLITYAPAAAEESAIGLPAPLDPQRPGSVMLHGGSTITEDAFERFVELAGGRDARIVLVPCAGYRRADYRSEAQYQQALRYRFSSWVDLATAGQIRSFRFLYTDTPDDAERGAFVRPLETATGVWFSGGEQSRLNWRFVGNFPQVTRFQQALREVVQRGGVVGGTSAGMAALPEVSTLWERYDDDTAPATAYARHGLALFNRAIVEQHFDARGGRLERFTGLLRDTAQLNRLAGRDSGGETMLGLAVEERTALAIRANRLAVLGLGKAHVFLKSDGGRVITWHELEPGETAQFQIGPTGGATLERAGRPAAR